MTIILKKYGINEISKEEYMEAYDMMTSESIKKLMLSKLKKDELTKAKEIIDSLKNTSLDELTAKTKKGMI